jgi:hypothetical protein
MTLPVWVVVLQALIAISVPLYLAWNARRKAPAEAAESLSRAADTLVKNMQERLDTVEGELKIAKARMAGLELTILSLESIDREHVAGIQLLIHQILALGQTPLYRMKE